VAKQIGGWSAALSQPLIPGPMLALTDVDGFSTLIDNRQSTGGKTVSRVQLALNVADLEASIAFYSKLFNSEPAKIRPGYANSRSPSRP
jgi:hypothetical protein